MSENNSPKVRDIEKRELNSIVTSYVESKTRMLNVPDLIDWDIVGRKVSPEMAEIGSFAGCDLTKVLEEYENVVDCETLDFWFVGMSQDDTYQYLNVRQKVLLTGDLGYWMKRKKLTLELRFMRSRDSIMYTDFYCDWYIFEMKRV